MYLQKETLGCGGNVAVSPRIYSFNAN